MGKVYDKIVEYGSDLYHVTEFQNLKSILRSGLLSLDKIKELVGENSVKYCTSDTSRRIDEQKGLSNYVRLAYTFFYDMIPAGIYYGRLINPVIICINPNILLEKNGIKFTNKNAVTTGARLYESEDEIFPNLDFDKIWKMRDRYCLTQEYRDARQSEVLIPSMVETRYFVKIFVESFSNYEELEKFGIEIFEVKEIKKKLNNW